MKTQMLKTFALASVLFLAFNAEAKVKKALAEEEAQVLEEVVEQQAAQEDFLNAFETEPSLYFYNSAGELVGTVKRKEAQRVAVRKLINRSDLMGEFGSDTYYLVN
ncbi:hypothetical protein QWY31_08440 [Cytophagales bacterium LB-30]|uniref:Uncharacterized protein n=1 Tax=Shiella aurantiaca TaxID=3058365 RepID=A0ABT8F504_9BACT|nr:hypothetical protein [Shiella aurantiaca]MDN4165526.1 hypothetical protein [Shiella aurantiaca]